MTHVDPPTETARAKRSTPLHFTRYEFKYVLPPSLRRGVEAQLAHFVQLDPFVAGRSGARYDVRSLYWDDPSFSAYHEKVDGLLLRSKFRLRAYSRDAAAPGPCFLEVKGRNNERVFKHRAPVRATAEDLTAGGDDLTEVVLAGLEPGPIRTAFEFQRARRRIAPVTLIDYLRRPYVSRFDPEFRLTFDEGLTATATERLFPRPVERVRRVAPGDTVMELKFRFHVPAWFHKIIQSFELRRQSFSKVCEGMQALGLATEDV